MSLRIETRNLTKCFGAFHAVDGVSLAFEPGLAHAVLGENGAGKSTLMKLLFGLHRPTSGEIILDGRPVRWRTPREAIARGFGMVQQHFSLVESLSAIDNVILGSEGGAWIDRGRAIDRLEERLPSPSLRVPWTAKIRELSVGERQRVEILKLLYRDARVLFLDEPTAVLAPHEIAEFFAILRALRDAGRTVVLITHKINEVFQLCDRYVVLRGGRAVAMGAVADATDAGLVESMIGRRPKAPASTRAPRREAMALDVRDLNETCGGRGAVRGARLQVREGEIVGIAGVEGSGQSSLVDAIFGLRAFSGEIRVAGAPVASGQIGRARELGCGLVPEDRLSQAIWADESVRKNMVAGLEGDFAPRALLDEVAIGAATDGWAEEFDVRCASLDAPIGSLSGGNQQKAVFARETAGRKPRLLICHQPTRGVDLGAIEAIRDRLLRLRNDGLAILLLSSELEELMALSDRILVFFEGRVTAEFARAEFDDQRIGSAMTGASGGLK